MNTSNPGAPAPGKKTFIPLENNPEVLTKLSRSLLDGSSPSFHDIFTLDPSYLATLQPATALIVTIPSPVYHRRRANDSGLPAKSSLRTVSGSSSYGPSTSTQPHRPPISQSASTTNKLSSEPMYIPQTIGHACGLISLLHALCNTKAQHLATSSNSLLSRFIADTKHISPAERAAYLYNSAEIENAHMTAARTGDTVAPRSEDPNGNHFITFVIVDDHLWELEGSSKVGGPICRGKMGKGKDVLSEEALQVTVQPYLDVAEGNMEFSMVAMS